MSYDLHLFRPQPGVELIATAHSLLADQDSDAQSPGPVDLAAEERKEALAAALQSLNPALERFRFDYSEIARLQAVSEDEARRRWRRIELNGPDGSSGIQITLQDSSAAIAVPYWHQGDKARNTWAELWSYLDVLERQGGYRTYDPQLEKVLDLGLDREAVLTAYDRGVSVTRQVAAKHDRSSPKPWWKIW